MKLLRWALLGLTIVAASAAAQDMKSLPGSETIEVTPEELEYLVQMCETCHGPGGASEREDVPVLAGRSSDELMVEIERFYFYERHCPNVPVDAEHTDQGSMSMCDVTNQISKQEALALTEYFQSSGSAGSQ